MGEHTRDAHDARHQGKAAGKAGHCAPRPLQLLLVSLQPKQVVMEKAQAVFAAHLILSVLLCTGSGDKLARLYECPKQ